MLGLVTPVTECARRNVVPTLKTVIDDPPLTDGRPPLPIYRELLNGLVGLSSASQNFDGNGSYTRFQTGGGPNTFSTGPTGVESFTGQPLFGNPASAPVGTRPARPATKPPQRRDVDCYRNDLPDLRAETGPGF